MCPLFVAPLLFPIGYRTFNLAVYQGSEKPRRGGQKQMEGTEWNCHKEGWLNFFYCFEDPQKNTCLFLIDQGGRAQFKLTTSYTK